MSTNGNTGLDGLQEPGHLNHSKCPTEDTEPDTPEEEERVSSESEEEELSERVDTRLTEEDTTPESTDRDFSEVEPDG